MDGILSGTDAQLAIDLAVKWQEPQLWSESYQLAETYYKARERCDLYEQKAITAERNGYLGEVDPFRQVSAKTTSLRLTQGERLKNAIKNYASF